MGVPVLPILVLEDDDGCWRSEFCGSAKYIVVRTFCPTTLCFAPVGVPVLPILVLEDDDGCWRSEFCGSAKYSAQ